MKKTNLQIDTLERPTPYGYSAGLPDGIHLELRVYSIGERTDLVCQLPRRKDIGDILKLERVKLDADLSVFSSLEADEVGAARELADDQRGLPGQVDAQTSADKLDVELEAFEALKPGLLKDFPGLFVAIHNGEVIDWDKDDFCLAERIEERARREGPIAICMVAREGDQALHAYPDAGFESPFG